MQDNAILNAIAKRSSIREYTGEVVSRDQLETIIKAGMAAPSAMNHQPWEFVAIDDRALLDKLGDVLPYAKMFTKRGLPSPSVETSKKIALPPTIPFGYTIALPRPKTSYSPSKPSA